MAASLLIECRGSTEEDLKGRIEEVQAALRKSGLPFGAKAAGAWAACGEALAGRQLVLARATSTHCLPASRSTASPTPPVFFLSSAPRPAEPQGLEAYQFHHAAKDSKVFWDVRRGLIPIVGGARKPGTSMLLEDVACPVDK